MLVDKQNLFSEKQAITATAESTNMIDLGASFDLPGADTHQPMELFVVVTEDFNNLTDLTVSVQSDDDAAFGSPKTIALAAGVALASLKEGYRFPIQNLPKIEERYVKVKYTVNGTAPTTGKITAGLKAVAA